MDRPYRYMRIGHPALHPAGLGGEHVLVPVMLVVINIAAIGRWVIGATLRLRRPGRAACRLGLLLPWGTSGSSPACPGTPRSCSPPSACWPGCRRSAAACWCRPLVLLAYGALDADTVMVAVAAIAIMRVIAMLRCSAQPGR